MDTVELRKKLNIIKVYLQEATKYASGCFQVFQDIKPEILKTEEDYDFEDFKDLIVFDETGKENINKEIATDRHFQFLKMQSNLNETMKVLDENRTRLYQDFMSKMKDLSHEIDALSSIYSFLKYWDEKATDNYELREYPEKFLKCLNKVPSSCRDKLVKDLSKIKVLQEKEMSLPNVLNDSKKLNERKFDVVIPSYQCQEWLDASKRMSSDKTFFNSTLFKNIEAKRKDDCVRGNTMKLGISVMDFTMNPDCDLNAFRNESFDMKDAPDLNASVLSNDILNQAIQDIEDIEDDAKPKFAKNHNFSVVDTSNPEMDDDDDYPEIEKIATTPEFGFNSFDITLEQSLNVSFPLKINDSLKMDDEESVSYISEGRSRRLNETEFSMPDLSNINFGYSFNNNSNVKLQHLDDDEELDD